MKKIEIDPDSSVKRPSYDDLIVRIQQLEKNIEEKILVENELREKVDLARCLIDNVPDMIWAKDIDDRYTFANHAFCEQLLQCSSSEEAEGKKDTFFADRERAHGHEHTFGEFCDNSDAIVKKTKKYQQFIESGLVRGKELILEVSKRPVINGDGELIGTVGCGRDVTHVRKTEKALQDASRIIRKLTDEVDSVAIQGYDEERRVTLWNTASVKLYGYKKSEAMGKTLEDLIIPDDMKTDVVELHRRWLEYGEKIPSGELTLIDKEGTPVHVFSTHVLQNTSYGKEMLCIDIDLSPLKVAEQERRKLHEQLQQAQKMEAIGVLAGGIAHDFNNLLTVILGNTELMIDRASEDSSMRDDLGQILQAGHRAKNLVGQILDFSRQKEIDAVPLLPGLIVKEVLELLGTTLPPQIVIEEEIDMESGCILADPTQFHQLCMNLCTNALQAMEKSGGILTVSIKTSESSIENLPHGVELLRGPCVELIVQDTGPGIPASVQEKIFEPYFTTKKIGEGSGMGLAIVHGIVKSCGGVVTCKSKADAGSVFTIHLPAISNYNETTEVAGDDVIKDGCERLLFVDDEEMLGRMAGAVLAKLGYDVSIESCPHRALEQFKVQPEKFDMLITDLTMPGMDGLELTKNILAIRDDLPVMLCTGNNSSLSEDDLRKRGIDKVVCKPFSKSEFASFIREVLDKKSQGK